MIEPSPGCVMDKGKMYLNDPEVSEILDSQHFYDDLWDESPRQ